MVKQKISVSVEAEIVRNSRDYLESGKFRNLSHLVEEAMKLLIEKENAAKSPLIDKTKRRID